MASAIIHFDDGRRARVLVTGWTVTLGSAEMFGVGRILGRGDTTVSLQGTLLADEAPEPLVAPRAPRLAAPAPLAPTALDMILADES